MQLKKRLIASVLALALLSLVALPAGAQVIFGIWVTEAGAGSTHSEAYDHAYDQLRDHGIVISSTVTVLSSLCHEDEILGITFCSVKLKARVIPVMFP